MSFSGRPSWKKTETKHLAITSHKELATLCCLQFLMASAKQGQICFMSKGSEIHKQFGMAAHTYPHSQTFFYVRFTWHYLPSLPSFKPTRLIDIVGERSTSQYHTALYPTAFIIVSFWIIGSYGLAGMTDTFLQVEQLQPGSPACPGKPCFTPCQMREGWPSVWPRGCTNTA